MKPKQFFQLQELKKKCIASEHFALPFATVYVVVYENTVSLRITRKRTSVSFSIGIPRAVPFFLTLRQPVGNVEIENFQR